jgi:hypothetical protein
LNPAALLPRLEVNEAPVIEGLPVTAKVPDNRLCPWAAPPPLSMNENVPEYPFCVYPSFGMQVVAQLPVWVLVACKVKIEGSLGPNVSPKMRFENVNDVGPDAETVVVPDGVAILHCCWDGLISPYEAKVTLAIAGLAAMAANAKVAARAPGGLDLLKDLIVIF